jgi:hypothetical protein
MVEVIFQKNNILPTLLVALDMFDETGSSFTDSSAESPFWFVSKRYHMCDVLTEYVTMYVGTLVGRWLDVAATSQRRT